MLSYLIWRRNDANSVRKAGFGAFGQISAPQNRKKQVANFS